MSLKSLAMQENSLLSELPGNPKYNVNVVGAFFVAQLGKNLPAMQATRGVRFLGWKEPLEEEMATHSSILAWKISWTEEPGRLQSMESQSQTRLSHRTHTQTRHCSWRSIPWFTALNVKIPSDRKET